MDDSKEIPIQEMFMGPIIGTMRLIDSERLTKLLDSGQFSFAGIFKQETDGKLTLIGMSLVPVERISHANLLKGEKP